MRALLPPAREQCGRARMRGSGPTPPAAAQPGTQVCLEWAKSAASTREQTRCASATRRGLVRGAATKSMMHTMREAEQGEEGRTACRATAGGLAAAFLGIAPQSDWPREGAPVCRPARGLAPRPVH